MVDPPAAGRYGRGQSGSFGPGVRGDTRIFTLPRGPSAKKTSSGSFQRGARVRGRLGVGNTQEKSADLCRPNGRS